METTDFSEKGAHTPASRLSSSATLACEDDSQQLGESFEKEKPGSETDWASLSQIVVSFFMAFNTWGLINSFGVYQTYYRTSGILGRSNSQISCLIVTGPLFDRGYSRWLICFGLVLDVFGMMMTNIATEYWQLILCQGICMGLGHGCLFIVAIGQLALTFKRRRWMAMGLAQSGGSNGAIIYSEIFHRLQPSIGAAWATRIIAFTMLATLLLSAILLHPYKLHRPRKMYDADAFCNKAFLAFAVASFTGFLGLYIPFFYIQEYALSHNIIAEQSKEPALSTLAILNTGTVMGRIVPGFIADEIGLMNTYTVCTIGATVFDFIWIACKNFGGIVVFAIIYGFFAGCAAALQPAVLASLAPTSNMVGTWVGLGSLFSATGMLLGNPLAGLILDNRRWLSLQLWSSCLVLACCLATGATRVLLAGTRIAGKV